MDKHRVMVLGCVGHMGPYIAEETERAGFKVRSLIWNADRTANLPASYELVEGKLNDVSRLALPLENVDAIIAQIGISKDIDNNPEIIDYASLRNLLMALEGRKIHVVILTAANSYMNTNEIPIRAYVLMRQAEMMIKCCGTPYTIIRSGKAKNGLTVYPRICAEALHEDPNQRAEPQNVTGEQRQALTCRQVARVISHCVLNPQAQSRTFEVFAMPGKETSFDEMLAAVPQDEFDVDQALSKNDGGLSNFPPEVIDDIRNVKALFERGVVS